MNIMVVLLHVYNNSNRQMCDVSLTITDFTKRLTNTYSKFIDILHVFVCKCPAERIVDMFHSSLDPETKTEWWRLSEPTATTVSGGNYSFGMGIDVKDVTFIFHRGLSNSSLDYWQELGRCGRDGRAGHAVLYPAPLKGRVQTD